MKNKIFQTIKVAKPKTNVFDLSHEKKLSLNMGYLCPIYIDEVVPGDKFRVKTEMLVRLAPMVAPVMHRIDAYIHYFFVPNRLVWDDWQNFITGGEDGLDESVFPMMPIGDGQKALISKGTLWDYMGLPVSDGTTTITQSLNVSMLPFRAYHTIFNEYYRDQNLRAKVEFSTGAYDSGDVTTLLGIKRRCWERDYFTSCLPWAEKGGEVEIPIEGSIEFVPSYKTTALGLGTAANGDTKLVSGQFRDASSNALGLDNLESDTYDIDGVSVTVNELRRSLRLQRWLERNARAGSRYIEQILAHFGVRSSDARLQRPEYLGGGKTPIVISEVLATNQSADVDLGTMGGHGVGVGTTNSFTKYFEEHGIIMGILSIIPKGAYQDNVPKMFSKDDKFDYYWPEFANLGEQEVLRRELIHYWYSDWDSDQLFGYQSRYAEYKFKPSTVHGDFKDDMDYWHMARQFSSKPVLNDAFTRCDPTHRIFAVTDPAVHKIYVQLYNDVKAIRPMPIFGTPTI